MPAAANPFPDRAFVAGSFSNGVAVVPSDTVDLETVASALHVGTAGALCVITFGGETVTFPHVPVGTFPLRVSRVKDTGTDADNIIALY